MSFDVKYNRDGQPMKSKTVEQALEAAAPVEVQAAPVVEEQVHAEPEVVENETDTAVEQEVAIAAPEVPQETPQAKNFRAIKDRAERAERERDEYFKMLQQVELSKQANSRPAEVEEDLNFNIDADALVEGKHLSKVDKKIQMLERKLAQYEQRSTESNAETRLKAQYADFDAVVTAENIAQLKEQYPELVQGIIATNDIYAKGKSAYMLLKKFGIAQDPVVQAEKALVQRNAAKPRPLSSVSPQQGNTPLSQANAFANGLTPELREQLAREVSQARRNL